MTDCRGDGATRFTLEPLCGASFGARLCFVESGNLGVCIEALETEPELLATVLGPGRPCGLRQPLPAAHRHLVRRCSPAMSMAHHRDGQSG